MRTVIGFSLALLAGIGSWVIPVIAWMSFLRITKGGTDA